MQFGTNGQPSKEHESVRLTKWCLESTWCESEMNQTLSETESSTVNTKPAIVRWKNCWSTHAYSTTNMGSFLITFDWLHRWRNWFHGNTKGTDSGMAYHRHSEARIFILCLLFMCHSQSRILRLSRVEFRYHLALWHSIIKPLYFVDVVPATHSTESFWCKVSTLSWASPAVWRWRMSS